MASIKVKKNLRGVFTTSWALLFAAIITILLSNQTIHVLNGQNYIPNFTNFFSQGELLVLYGSLIGLLLAAYAIIITLIPLFSAESLKEPIFSQINRLFLFTIMDGIFLMVTYFMNGLLTNGVLPLNQIPYFNYFIYFEVFLFFALLVGLFFCVLTLGDLFKIIRRRGER